ncbi:hypothetical protein [Ammoniphilus sp. CFH 90114]|uniref:hypothetical protein n=1 Tax=Ammoniphilus sp. CFH 90114 TaxID=2493665 RepID=UPI00100FC214|nr:hypothetical protein [Ammoniphilus sp. CFH 90114]RXT03804.1 hypothetical protein EIZ39_22760 [Ammoniphilus sp. CFH 90114]
MLLRMEFLRLIRNQIAALVFGYIGIMVILLNALSVVWARDPDLSLWIPKITIGFVVILLDLIFWLAALQISEDMETQMIQVMRTSRSPFQYFVGKHGLLLLMTGVASSLAVAMRLGDLLFVLQFVYLSLLVALLMIGSGVLIVMLVKKQSIVMAIGSLVTGLIFAVMVRLVFPNWNVDPIPYNPFESFIQAYYDLYLPGGAVGGSDLLMILTFVALFVYASSVLLFKHITFKKGFRL